MQVIERLADIYGDLYTMENVMISPTHSHATPGGQNTYWMYQVPTGGFINETFDAYVDGIVAVSCFCIYNASLRSCLTVIRIAHFMSTLQFPYI